MPHALQLGVDLGGTKTEIIALDADGATRLRRRVKTPSGYEAILDAIAALVLDAERSLGARGTLGVGTPGALSPASGRLMNSNTTCLNGRPLDVDLSARLERTVRLANDADCFALSEATDGAGRGARSVFGVIVGTGTGAGVVVDGALLSGPNGIAGEWGHNPLPWPRDDERPGPSCYCGREGCLETWLSGPGLAADHERVNGARLDGETLAALARSGDQAAAATLERHVDRMARGLASVLNVLDPEVVVLGGGVSNLPGLPDSIAAALEPYVFSDAIRTAVRVATHGDSSGVRGAAWLGADQRAR